MCLNFSDYNIDFDGPIKKSIQHKNNKHKQFLKILFFYQIIVSQVLQIMNNFGLKSQKLNKNMNVVRQKNYLVKVYFIN